MSLTEISSENSEDEFITQFPPSSLVPRLHCVTFRKLNNSDLVIPHPQISKSKKKMRKCFF